MLDRWRKTILVAAAACAALIGCSCEDNSEDGQPIAQCAPGEPAAANYAVLIDLSGTWHNEESRQTNEKLLQTVAGALIKATENASSCPTAIRYHIIGANSLYREPVCDVNYVPVMISRGNSDPSLITRPNDLKRYLSERCPLLLNAKPEKLTQVTATLVTAVNSMTGHKNAARRIVVYSDLKEEPVQTYDLSSVDFSGVDVILLYRALPEDQKNPQLLEERVRHWTQQLEARGARVVVGPDTGLGGSVGDLAMLLASGIPKP